ncbi:hypothetical protein SAMN04490182_2679 [Pseudomonas cedrina]|uniref:Uncharacterized protein n=2 Tax=Pseudomonas cedrina TaxID=651740 RepID=A0A1V2KDY5_PSECE|nr:hypothetical protein [Pseudomonas cedrina]ONH55690.1 hypothetical protein BLL36_06130 [Pseudomonas cedrina subsp. cedrina]SDS89118.1 hypothetical protein SAMN04490182_2679 [Pseudomonas cedrina]
MKTRSSQRILLIVGLSALLTGPALAAFGDNPEPAANLLSGDSATGSALPPGNFPSSPSDSDKKSKDTDEQPRKPAEPAQPPEDSEQDSQSKTRSGS